MEISALKQRPNLEANKKLNQRFLQFEALLKELRERVKTAEVISVINEHIEKVNSASDDKSLKKGLIKAQYGILRFVEKELKLVPKNHYRNNWLAVGMAIGVGIGAGIGVGSDNIGLLGLGIPIGMAIGIGIGNNLDKQAAANGFQLDLELKY